MNLRRTTEAKSVPRTVRPSFEIKLVSPFSLMATYRVFLERNDFIFIRIGGGKRSILETLAPLLGPFGNLIPLVFWLFNRAKVKVGQKRLEEADPEDLLRESDANFKLYLAEIREAVIDPPGFISVSSTGGRLSLLVRHGERFKGEFENGAQMKQAIVWLEPLLGQTLSINAEWNASTGKFEKKKDSARTSRHNPA